MNATENRWLTMVPLRLFFILVCGLCGCEDPSPETVEETPSSPDVSVPETGPPMADGRVADMGHMVAPEPDRALPDAGLPLFPCEAVAPTSAQQKPGRQDGGVAISITGRGLTPTGDNRLVRGMPANVVFHPSGQWAYLITQGRDDRALLVLSMEDFTVRQDLDLGEAYYGMAITTDGDRLFVSAGDHRGVATFVIDDAGGLTREANLETGGYPAGIALSADERSLFVGLFDRPAVLEVKIDSGDVYREIEVPGIPWDVEYVAGTQTLFVGDLGGNEVYAVDPAEGEIRARISVNRSPAGMVAAPDGSRLWVAVSAGDVVAAIDPMTLDVTASAPVALEGPLDEDGVPLPNSNVNALAFDPLTNRLYAARGADNAVSVLDGSTLEFLGAFPTGEYPTGIALAPGGQEMVVAEARGGQPGPNEGRSPKAAISGSTSRIDLRALDLTVTSAQVDANLHRPNTAFPFECDGFFPIPTRRGQRSPIEHVFLVVKENKTFDCIFGDLDGMGADTDPSLVRWGEEITPNLHALAREFALSDNFYAEVEDSDVGHVLLTATHLTEYVHRIWMEKDRSGQIPEGYQIGNASVPKEGNFFTHLMQNDVSIRIYGEIVGMFARAPGLVGNPIEHSDPNFPGGPFVNYEVTDETKMRYVIDQIQDEDPAQFTFISLPNDHTVGTSAGAPTPESMVADNDYAVGLLVAALAESDLWEKSAVFILQDDPQGCEDHVDVHRSFLLVASPWAKRGHISHAHGSFASVFATIERILGVPPMGRSDATAAPLWDLFEANGDPVTYIARERGVPEAFNPANLPGAEASARMDFRGPDRNPGLVVVLDAYRLWRMGHISREEAQQRIDHPTLSLQRWAAILEEAVEERFAFDHAMGRYRAYLSRRAAGQADRPAAD